MGTTTYVPSAYVPTTLATTIISGPAAGGPTQSGQLASCRLWYQVVAGDSCDGIVAKFGGFSLASFYACNPYVLPFFPSLPPTSSPSIDSGELELILEVRAVGTHCGGLWLGYFVCVRASG